MAKDAVGDAGGGTDRPAHSTDYNLVYVLGPQECEPKLFSSSTSVPI